MNTLLLAMIMIPSADPEPVFAADLVLVGGKVWTVDPRHPEAEAVAVWRDRIVKVRTDTKEPAGGVIYRLDDGKTPSGILKDNAMGLVDRLVPEPDEAEITEAVQASMRACAENGITSVQDMDGSADQTRRTLFRVLQKM